MDKLQELKHLLLGEEQSQIQEISEKIDHSEIDVDKLADQLPDAIRKKSAEDNKLVQALEEPVAQSVHSTITKNPDAFAEILFPIMAPAIRRAITETVRSMLQSINQVVDQTFSLKGIRWRLEAARTNVPFHDIVMKHTLLYRVEQVFLIQKESGLLIRHLADESIITQDPDAISGMLTAIQDFANDSFNTGGKDRETLETIDMGNHNIWIIAGSDAILACDISGIPPADLRIRFANILDGIHAHFPTQMMTFSGNSDDYVDADELLKECLLSEQKTAEKKRTSLFLPVLTIVLIAALGWYFYQDYKKNSLFKSLKSDLQQAPGLILLTSERNGEQFLFTGLKDPLAPDPDEIVSKHQVATENISFNWKPFIALDNEIILLRATKILDPPHSVNLKLDNQQLIATGLSNTQWREKCEQIAKAIAGIENCITKDLKDIDIDALLLEKSKQQFQPPPGVNMQVVNTVLIASGHAPKAWIEQLNKNYSTIDGLTSVDGTALQMSELLSLQQAIKQFTAFHIQFSNNTSMITEDEQIQKLDAAAKSIINLHSLSTTTGIKITLNLTGRSAGSTNNPANILLSRQRAQAVYDYLVNTAAVPSKILMIDNQLPDQFSHLDLISRRVDITLQQPQQQKGASE